MNIFAFQALGTDQSRGTATTLVKSYCMISGETEMAILVEDQADVDHFKHCDIPADLKIINIYDKLAKATSPSPRPRPSR